MNVWIYDFFDENFANPKKSTSNRPFKSGENFDIDGVTYNVVKAWSFKDDTGLNKIDLDFAVVRMVKYRIPDTSTQFIHKCPAKKGAVTKLTREDVVKLKDKVGAKKISKEKQGRVKMKSYRVNIKGYGRGIKENDYVETTHFLHTAIARAVKQFKQDHTRVRFDEIHIKVI